VGEVVAVVLLDCEGDMEGVIEGERDVERVD